MRRLTGLYLLLSLGLGVPGSLSAHTSPSPDEVVIHIAPTGYTPRHLTITAGTSIVFENTSSTPLWPASNIHPTHEIYAEFDPRQPIDPGQSWRFTFADPGVWTYHDHLHPQITGTITVTEAAASWTIPTWLTAAFRPFIAAFRPPRPLPYTLQADIKADSPDIFTNSNALYSYIHNYGLPRTIEHLHNLSGQFGSCHDAAHKAGRIAYEVSGNDAFTQCQAECHSGCYHGAAELFFREHGTNNLAANLTTLCSSEVNSFMSHQCLHGIGHGLMAWTNYEIHEALQACDLLPYGQASCYTGVFMENVVGALGSSDGHFTNYVNDDPEYPCTVVAERYKFACYFYQTSRMLQLFGPEWPRLAATCQGTPTRFHRHCFESMGRDVGGAYATDLTSAIKACAVVTTPENRQHCFNGAVQNYFWEPSGEMAAREFCRTLSNQSDKSACYVTIFTRAALVLSALDDRAHFCENVEAPWRAPCREAILSTR